MSAGKPILTQHHIDLVKSTVPLLEEAGTEITEYFYRRLFRDNPEVQHIFNMSNQHSGRQQFALFAAIAAYAKHLDTPELLLARVERIAHKHSSMNIRPEHYPIVGHHLIATLRELLPQQFSAEIEQAWGLAYQQLADIFIAREQAIYTDNATRPGGWQQGRRFVLAETRIESQWVKTLVFKPVDGAAVVAYQPGQYIGIEVEPPGCEYREIRQYSLSSASQNDRYQISVKRERNGRPGIVSNYLHDGLHPGDEVTLYAPAGDFYLQSGEQPLVLVAAGVGLTPMQAMLETVAASQPQRAVHYLHACHNPAQHSFRQRNHNLARDMNLSLHCWYQSEVPDQPGCYHGYMDISQLDSLPLDDGEFYLCGPLAFMGYAKQQLLAAGVDAERIHYEVFGPHQDL